MRADFVRPRGVWRVLCARALRNPYALTRSHVSMAGYLGGYSS